MFALMMQCRTGTRYLYGEAWHDMMTSYGQKLVTA
jgi:hypothetical protein